MLLSQALVEEGVHQLLLPRSMQLCLMAPKSKHYYYDRSDEVLHTSKRASLLRTRTNTVKVAHRQRQH